jgi:hypothetical protein
MTQKVFDYNIDTTVFDKYSINVVRIANVEVTDSNYSPINEFANIASVDNTGGFIKINGSGFAANAQVYYNVNTSLTTTSITSTEIRAVVPATTTGNYNLYVQNPSGSTAFRIQLLKVGGPVNWVTGSSLGIATTNSQTSIALSATADSALTYEITSGSLPPGFYLNASTGEISGNVQLNIPYTTYSFTVRAIDAEYQSNARLFTLPVANTVAFSISPAVSGKTTWIVAVDGPLNLGTGATTYTVTPNANTAVNVKMWGAGGGAGQLALGAVGAAGGFTRGILRLYKSNTYNFIVGAGGSGGTGARVAGGGGGGTGIQIVAGTIPLMVAGGGGGSWGTSFPPAFNEARGGGGGGSSGQTPDGSNGGTGGSQGGAGGGGTLSPGPGFAGSGRNGGDGGSATPSSWPASGGIGFGNGGRGGFNNGAAGGGGGGGGYFGGGGGSHGSASYGGGGGSGYIHPTEVIGERMTITSNFQTVANTADAIRGSAGSGGPSIGASGSAGRIYITQEYMLN